MKFWLLSEIIMSLENKNEIEKYNEIINYINLNGFKEAVLKFSISNLEIILVY